MNEEYFLCSLKEILNSEGFSDVKLNSTQLNMPWVFDVLASKDGSYFGIEIRKDERINPLFIEKINQIKYTKTNLFIYVFFEKAPLKSTIDLLDKSGVGSAIVKEGRIFYISHSRNFSLRKAKKEIKKRQKLRKNFKSMHQIWVFPSSKQYEFDGRTTLKERQAVISVVHEIARRHQIPISVHLVENDTRDGRKFKRKILKNLKETHIFVGVIREQYSPFVEYEFKKVFDIISDNNMILIMKKNLSKSDLEKGQSRLIQFVESRTNHIPYDSIKEFKDKVYHSLLGKIISLYNKQGCELPFGI